MSGCDFVSQTQLRAGLKRLRLNAICVETAFQEIDLDRDGRISERDFIRHFAAGWHDIGDFVQIRKLYENVKAKGRQLVAHSFRVYIDELDREDEGMCQTHFFVPPMMFFLEC
jgi:Ca2+-binding EF-hand superfamily protein